MNSEESEREVFVGEMGDKYRLELVSDPRYNQALPIMHVYVHGHLSTTDVFIR